jgi:hypothetical protein
LYFCGVIRKDKTMTVVSSKEFAANEDKYFDLALEEQVYVKRGDYMFYIMCSNRDTENIKEQKILAPDDDLCRAITAEELLKRIHKRLDEKFKTRLPA